MALRGLLWCAECGQKMSAHVRDWDYTCKKRADGTKARYRIQKQEQLVLALISRIDVDKNNQVRITLRLDTEAIRGPHQPNPPSASSRRHGSEKLVDSPSEGSDNSKAVPDHRRKESAGDSSSSAAIR